MRILPSLNCLQRESVFSLASRKILRRVFFTLLPACLCLFCQGQTAPFLLLEKPAKKRIRYYTGDEITFKLRGAESENKAVLTGFGDSLFYVNKRDPILLRKVEYVADRSNVKGVHLWSRNVLLVIPSFFLFSAANNYFNTGRTPVVDREVWGLAGIFAVVGGSGYLYKGRKYRTGKRWRLIVVDP